MSAQKEGTARVGGTAQTDLPTRRGGSDTAGAQKYHSLKGNRQRRQTEKAWWWEGEECSVSPGNNRKQKQHMRSLEKMVCPRNRKPFGLANQGGQRRRVEGCNWRTGFKHLINKTLRKFPGGSVVRTPHFHTTEGKGSILAGERKKIIRSIAFFLSTGGGKSTVFI